MEDWYMYVAFACVGFMVGVYVYRFISLPTPQKMELFRTTLYELVKEAENRFGSKTGTQKLEYVWNAVVAQFPIIEQVLSLDTFETMVKGALYETGIWLKK